MRINEVITIEEDASSFITKVGRGLSNTLKKVSGDAPVDYDQIDQTKKHGNYDPKVNPNDLGDIGVDQTKNWPSRYDNTKHNTDWTNYNNKSLNPTGIKKQGAWDLDKLSNQTADSIGVDRQQFKRIRDYPEDYPRDNKFHSDSKSRAERQKQYDAYFTIHGTDNIDSNRGYEDNPYVQDYKKRKEWENQPQRESTNEDGVIVPGVNTTVDVKPGETERQAAKFGNGKIKPLHKKAAANSSPHTLFNMGLTEGQYMFMEAVVKQSEAMRVMYNLANRKDSIPFPVRLHDGEIVNMKPGTAKRIVMFYLDAEEEMQTKVEELIKSKAGILHLLKKFK